MAAPAQKTPQHRRGLPAARGREPSPEHERRIGLAPADSFSPPLTQQHLADTLGLSIVHTNKTLKRLSDRKIIRWKTRALEILDVKALREIAWWEDDETDRVRPLI